MRKSTYPNLPNSKRSWACRTRIAYQFICRSIAARDGSRGNHLFLKHLLKDAVRQLRYVHLDDARLAQLSSQFAHLLGKAIFERAYDRETKKVVGDYGDWKPQLATTDVLYAARCATCGAIDRLMIDIDANIPGIVGDNDWSVPYAASDDAELTASFRIRLRWSQFYASNFDFLG